MPSDKLKELISCVNYFKITEDDWFMDLVNKRTNLAAADRKAGKRFTTLKELQEGRS